MKKMLGIVILLFIFYLVFQVAYNFLTGGFVLDYVINVDNQQYKIKETYHSYTKTDKLETVDYKNYYYEITNKDNNDFLITFKLIGEYRGIKRFLQDLKIYEKENIYCVYPVFKDHNNQFDVICQTENGQVTYANLKHSNPELDDFISSLKQKGYNHPAWESDPSEEEPYEQVEIYKANLLNNQNVIIWNYKGFYNITNKVYSNIKVLNKDVYNNNLGVLINQYYLIPHYLDAGYFNKISIVNILTKSIIPIELPYKVATDSFVQGVVSAKLYFLDKSNYIQYEFDLERRKINIIGDSNIKGRYYKDGEWEERSIYEMVNKELTFKSEQVIPSELEQYRAEQIDEVLGATAGFYYLYKKEENMIAVYRVDKQNLNIITLLFKVPNVSNIKYFKDSIYFISDDILYMYQDRVGLKPLAKYKEFYFNQNNMYDIYVK